MAEVLVEFAETLTADSGLRYRVHACGGPTTDGTWQGWLEFLPLDGGQPIRSGRETTQPNRTDTLYWATGLSLVYLEGALGRSLAPVTIRQHVEPDGPLFDGPAPIGYTAETPATETAVLDPFAAYARGGESLLRRQLTALAAWHLVNIVREFELSDEPASVLSRLPAADLIERIAVAVQAGTGPRQRSAPPARRR